MFPINLKMNVRKHKNLIVADKYDEFQSELKGIHISCNEKAHIDNCKSLKKYSKEHKEMYNY